MRVSVMVETTVVGEGHAQIQKIILDLDKFKQEKGMIDGS
jgi:hypothetical protein